MKSVVSTLVAARSMIGVSLTKAETKRPEWVRCSQARSAAGDRIEHAHAQVGDDLGCRARPPTLSRPSRRPARKAHDDEHQHRQDEEQRSSLATNISSPTFCSRKGSTPAVAAVAVIARSRRAGCASSASMLSRRSRLTTGQAAGLSTARLSEARARLAGLGSACCIVRSGFRVVQADQGPSTRPVRFLHRGPRSCRQPRGDALARHVCEHCQERRVQSRIGRREHAVARDLAVVARNPPLPDRSAGRPLRAPKDRRPQGPSRARAGSRRRSRSARPPREAKR